MARRCIAVCLALLVASTAYGQSLNRSIERVAAEAAARQQPEPSARRINPALLWTGVGLLGAGGLYLGLGAAEDADAQTCIYGNSIEDTCVSNRTVLLTTGAVMAGVGGALLAIGIKKSHSPQVTFRPGGFAVRQPVPLDLGVGHLIRR
jgi:hypothetical protein